MKVSKKFSVVLRSDEEKEAYWSSAVANGRFETSSDEFCEYLFAGIPISYRASVWLMSLSTLGVARKLSNWSYEELVSKLTKEGSSSPTPLPCVEYKQQLDIVFSRRLFCDRAQADWHPHTDDQLNSLKRVLLCHAASNKLESYIYYSAELASLFAYIFDYNEAAVFIALSFFQRVFLANFGPKMISFRRDILILADFIGEHLSQIAIHLNQHLFDVVDLADIAGVWAKSFFLSHFSLECVLRLFDLILFVNSSDPIIPFLFGVISTLQTDIRDCKSEGDLFSYFREMPSTFTDNFVDKALVTAHILYYKLSASTRIAKLRKKKSWLDVVIFPGIIRFEKHVGDGKRIHRKLHEIQDADKAERMRIRARLLNSTSFTSGREIQSPLAVNMNVDSLSHKNSNSVYWRSESVQSLEQAREKIKSMATDVINSGNSSNRTRSSSISIAPTSAPELEVLRKQNHELKNIVQSQSERIELLEKHGAGNDNTWGKMIGQLVKINKKLRVIDKTSSIDTEDSSKGASDSISGDFSKLSLNQDNKADDPPPCSPSPSDSAIRNKSARRSRRRLLTPSILPDGGAVAGKKFHSLDHSIDLKTPAALIAKQHIAREKAAKDEEEKQQASFTNGNQSFIPYSEARSLVRLPCLMMEGFLFKLRGTMAFTTAACNIVRRWFVLKGSFLAYFQSELHTRAIKDRMIDMRGSSVEPTDVPHKLADQQQFVKNSLHALVIRLKDNHQMLLLSESRTDRDLWVSILKVSSSFE